eukprot:TRINITY_DN615_c0_g1_i1.p1 TRINITY_DN615_c0_g1~~TRINITY_DN615_c0_g1_i1.p1  ORF type:complete len:1806 (-),score=610.31 TRINITY_DN615_c0_g1_i1:143-5560(-)
MKVVVELTGVHQRGVCALSFSPDGNLLCSVGLSNSHNVALWSWAKGKTLANVKGHSDSIFTIEWIDNSRFMTGGVKHVKFWTWNGSNLDNDRGLFGGNNITTVLGATLTTDGRLITANYNGTLYAWDPDTRKVTQVVPAHKGAAYGVTNDGENIFSVGADGMMVVFNYKLEKVDDTEAGGIVPEKDGKPCALRSIAIGDGEALIGTYGCDILEVDFGDEGVSVVMQGHEEGEVWGLATHPSKDTFATTSDDGTVRLYDMSDRKQTACKNLHAGGRSCDFSPDGKLLAVGLLDGSFNVLRASSLEQVYEDRDRVEKICDIKFSPNGKYLAVASNDNFIDLYDCDNKFKRIGICKGHSSFVTHIDWSADSKFIRSNDGAHSELCFDVENKCRIAKLKSVKEWGDYTCTLGDDRDGIWPKGSDKTDVNAADRSKNNGTLFATADDFGLVKLFAWPPDRPHARYKKFKGHSSHVTNVRFSHDNRYVISTGGLDQSVFQWEVTDANDSDSESDDDAQDDVDSDVIREAAFKPQPRKLPAKKQAAAAAAGKKGSGGKRRRRSKRTLDKDISAPKTVKPLKFKNKPVVGLELDYVHGYRGNDCRNNVYANSKGQVVYHAAAVGIVHDRKTNTQRVFNGHTDDIVSLAVHPDGDIIATGQVGRDPEICIWDSKTLKVLSKLKGKHARGVTALAFSPSGKMLASVGADDQNTVVLWKWQKGVAVDEVRGGLDKIFDIEFNPYDEEQMVTCGVKHISFWKVSGNTLKKQKGVFGKICRPQTVLAVAFTKDHCIAGASDGDVLFFEGNKCVNHVGKNKHAGPVNSIESDGETFVTGSKDGTIKIWDSRSGKPLSNFDVSSLLKSEVNIRSVHTSGDDVYIGTWDNSVHILSTKATKITTLVDGHGMGEVWGLDTHPSEPKAVTVSEDKTIRVWDLKKRVQIKHGALSTKGRCVAWAPAGDHIAVGTYKGSVLIIDGQSLKELASFRQRREKIGDIKYSPDGRYLAVASHDNFIDLYDTADDYNRIGVCGGHSSFVTHVDWSTDSKFLMSNCGAHERLFWMNDGKRVTRTKEMAKVQWFSYTGVLGDDVQGIWPKGSDKTDVNAADRSNSGNVFATADDFGYVKLFTWPVVTKYAKARKYLGHSAHVTNIRFSCDDSYVVSTGGNDACVFVWKTEEAEDDSDNSAPEGSELDDLVKDRPNKFVPKNTKRKEQIKAVAGQALPPAPKIDFSKVSQGSLELDWVHGFRTEDALNNIVSTKKGELVYFTAGVGIVYDPKKHTQRFYRGHTDDIVSIDNHPDGTIIATGQVGRHPSIRVWDSARPDNHLAVLKGHHTRAVVALAFSEHDGGKLLASVGADDDHTIAVYDWRKGHLRASAKGHSDKVLTVAFNPVDGSLVSGGVKHITHWSVVGNQLDKHKSVFGANAQKQTVLSIAFDAKGNTFSAGSQGDIYQWRLTGSQFKVVKVIHEDIHNGPVYSLRATNSGYTSCGSDGKVVFYDANWKVSGTAKAPSKARVVTPAGSDVYCGLQSGAICQASPSGVKPVLQAHADQGELWALATHPSRPYAVTGSDDNCVYLWDADKHKSIAHADLGRKVRAAAYAPDGSVIAAGYVDGGWSLLNGENLGKIASKRHCREAISDIKFSPDGSLLAVGSRDNFIDIYDTKNKYKRIARCTGHSSFITHLDFTNDGSIIMSNSGAYEQLFWEARTGKRLTDRSLKTRLDWHTWTCTEGGPVQGVVPVGADGTDVNAACRSHSRKVLATADDFGTVKMFQFPASQQQAPNQKYTGHSAHVTSVRFTYDDKYLFSTGGGDNSVLQWKVV